MRGFSSLLFFFLGGLLSQALAANHSQDSSSGQSERVSSQERFNYQAICNEKELTKFLKALIESNEKSNTTIAQNAARKFFENTDFLPKPGFFDRKTKENNLSLIRFVRRKAEDTYSLKLSDAAEITFKIRNQNPLSISSISILASKGASKNYCSQNLPQINLAALESPFDLESKKRKSKSIDSRLIDFIHGKIQVPSSPRNYTWSASYYKIAADVSQKHPDLLGLSQKNLFGSLCHNYLSLSLDERKAVIAKTLMALAWAETQFNRNDRGDERRSSEKSSGIFQLSPNVKKGYGCQGYLGSVNADSVDCVMRIFEQKGVAASDTFWSVLRPHYTTKWYRKTIRNPMERRFMPTFKAYVPECKEGIGSEPNFADSKAPPSEDIIGPGLFDPSPQQI